MFKQIALRVFFALMVQTGFAQKQPTPKNNKHVFKVKAPAYQGRWLLVNQDGKKVSAYKPFSLKANKKITLTGDGAEVYTMEVAYFVGNNLSRSRKLRSNWFRPTREKYGYWKNDNFVDEYENYIVIKIIEAIDSKTKKAIGFEHKVIKLRLVQWE